MKKVIVILVTALLFAYFSIPEEDSDSADPGNTLVCLQCKGWGCYACGYTGAIKFVTNEGTIDNRPRRD